MRTSESSILPSLLGTVTGIIVTLWATAGRTIFGIDGTLTLILVLVGAPILMTAYLLLLWVPVLRQRKGRGQGLSARAAWFFVGSVMAATIFGFLSPDFGHPDAMSVFEYVAGSDVAGMSAAIANPFGIATLFFAAFSLGFALRDSSGTKSYVLVRNSEQEQEDSEEIMIRAPWLEQHDPLKK